MDDKKRGKRIGIRKVKASDGTLYAKTDGRGGYGPGQLVRLTKKSESKRIRAKRRRAAKRKGDR